MTRHEVIADALPKYLKASKEEKGAILDRLEETVKMHRKAISRRLRALQLRDEGVRSGRGIEVGSKEWKEFRKTPRLLAIDNPVPLARL
jgi:hypothetical protein